MMQEFPFGNQEIVFLLPITAVIWKLSYKLNNMQTRNNVKQQYTPWLMYKKVLRDL